MNMCEKIEKKKSLKSSVLITVKRCNKLVEALTLPKVANLNPRSIYNKVDEFCTLVEEENIDVICMSESHERWYTTRKGETQGLNDLIKI